MKKQHELDRMIPLVREMVVGDCSDEEIIAAFQNFRVTCIGDANNLSTHSGQVALVTLISLVARMGVQIDIRIPEIELFGVQPPLNGCYLRSGILDLGSDLIPGSAITCWDNGKVDVALVMGDTAAPRLDCASWRLVGTAWSGTIHPIERKGAAWSDAWPIGAMVAAALAASEVFKAVVRQIQLSKPTPFWLEYVDQIRDAAWDFGHGLPIPHHLDMDQFDMVSGGAVSQALYFALMRLPEVHLRSRVFDNDTTDNTNLNRNLLSRYRHIGMKKIDVIRSYDIQNITAVCARLTEVNIHDYVPLAPSVLVGADDIPTRWLIQSCFPQWLGVCGTSHFGTLTSSHTKGEACAGCLHWHDEQGVGEIIPTVSFISFWAGLALAVRVLRKEIGRPYSKREQALWLVPLRMDDPNAGFWSTVSPRADCPVQCQASRAAIAR
ncbi:MAG: hypothetical protein KGJ82_01075 [Nitrospirota bacterium]|nr:hypothetical protein [Nitrospirota bacterium]